MSTNCLKIFGAALDVKVTGITLGCDSQDFVTLFQNG